MEQRSFTNVQDVLKAPYGHSRRTKYTELQRVPEARVNALPTEERARPLWPLPLVPFPPEVL